MTFNRVTAKAWASAIGMFLAGQCIAQVAAPTALPARLDQDTPCVSTAAQYHSVNPWILKAILYVESQFNPRAVNRNANGTVDVGMAQINSIHFGKLAKFGIAPADLLDGCKATYVAAWHLANQIRVHGNTWFGVASYHSSSKCQNTRYAGLVRNALVGWGVVPGPRVKVSTLAQCGYVAPPQRPRKLSKGGGVSTMVAFDE